MSISQAALYERRQSPAKPHWGEAGRPAYGKTVWSRPSSLRPSLADAALAPTGAVPVTSVGRGRPEGIRLPGEHGISRPTTAQGRPCVRLHLYAAVQFLCATCAQRTVGASWHPAFPAPFLSRGGRLRQSSGGRRREKDTLCPRREVFIGGYRAIPCSVIARAGSNPESLRGGSLDCFVARAPRNNERRGRVSQLRQSDPPTSPRLWRDRIGSTKKSSVDGCAPHLDESTLVGP